MKKRKTARRLLRRPFETGGFLLIKSIIPLLPRWGVTGLADMAARIAMLLPLREKKIGMQNMHAVFGDSLSDTEKRGILRVSFRTFSQTMMDVFWFSRKSKERINRYVDFEDSPLKHSFFRDEPAICITAHIGSWELLGQACAMMGVDLASIAATVKNTTVDRILIKHREGTGQTIIPQKGALKTLISRFRKNGKAAFVLDQKTAEQEGGIHVDLLGLPMPVSSAPAALAYRTGTKILLGFCLPEPEGHYCIRVTQEIVPPPYDKKADQNRIITDLTRQILDGISAEILDHPQFWLWSYKHWRRSPGKVYPAHYPSY